MISAIKSATPDGLGPHAAIIVSSAAAAYEEALENIRPGGTVVAVGLPPDAYVKANVFWHVSVVPDLFFVGHSNSSVLPWCYYIAMKNGKEADRPPPPPRLPQVVCERKLIGSYVGNRQDSIEALDLAAAGKVKCIYTVKPLEELPGIYTAMHDGKLVSSREGGRERNSLEGKFADVWFDTGWEDGIEIVPLILGDTSIGLGGIFCERKNKKRAVRENGRQSICKLKS